MVGNDYKIKIPKKQCWWCQETFEEGSDIHLYKSGWLCDKCKSYLETQSGDKEIPVEEN